MKNKIIWLIILIGLIGCANQEKPKQEQVAAQIGIVNHTGKYIYSATINSSGGGRMSAWGAGIANICCISIPRIWHPEMKVVVEWNMPEGINDVIKKKIVSIEKYDRPGSIYLHFFPNDQVRVIVSNLDPVHPEYPIPAPVKPLLNQNH
jgi:hypothetical protein